MTKLSTIHCSYFPTCSGCKRQTDLLDSPLWREITQFFASHNPALSLILHHDKITGWRTRVKLAVRGTAQQPLIGLFKEGTHEVVDIVDCPLHHPAINQTLAIIRQTLALCPLEPYREKAASGLLRYLQLVVERKSRKVQLTLVINANEIIPSLSLFVKQLYTHDIWHSIWINFQPGATNTILSNRWHQCGGESVLWETLNGKELCFHPACFAQANLDLFDTMLQQIQTHLLPQKTVLELFAGVGPIGFTALEKSRSVHCIESNPFAKGCFEKALQKLPELQQHKITFHALPAEKSCPLLEEAEVVIVDPPRKGLDAHLRQAILSQPKLEQFIYISCGWKGFMRDCTDLINNGWEIHHAAGYLLIPGSDHIEILAIFQKKSL